MLIWVWCGVEEPADGRHGDRKADRFDVSIENDDAGHRSRFIEELGSEQMLARYDAGTAMTKWWGRND